MKKIQKHCEKCKLRTLHRIVIKVGIITRYRTILNTHFVCLICGNTFKETEEKRNKNVQIWD